MIPLIVVGTFGVVPFIVALVWRVHVAFVFLSIAAGHLLVRYLGDDALFSLLSLSDWRYIGVAVQLFLLVTPVLLTLLFMRKTLITSQVIVQVLPMIATCLMLLVFTLSALPSDVVRGVYDLPGGDILRKSQDVIVGLACVMVLLTSWQSFRASPNSKQAKHT